MSRYQSAILRAPLTGTRRVVLLGDAEDGLTTGDTSPELQFNVPNGFTLPGPVTFYDESNPANTFGPFTVTGGNVVNATGFPAGRFPILGTPARDEDGNPVPVAGVLVVVTGIWETVWTEEWE